jgi:hypothetical protein
VRVAELVAIFCDRVQALTTANAIGAAGVPNSAADGQLHILGCDVSGWGLCACLGINGKSGLSAAVAQFNGYFYKVDTLCASVCDLAKIKSLFHKKFLLDFSASRR